LNSFIVFSTKSINNSSGKLSLKLVLSNEE
jgi:hypothetical protein